MSLTKQQRIIAYKMADEILNRPIPAVVAKRYTAEFNTDDTVAIMGRVYEILGNLRADAKDLWDESLPGKTGDTNSGTPYDSADSFDTPEPPADDVYADPDDAAQG